MALSPGDTVFRIERNSSVTTSGKHATKLVANPNVPVGFVMSKAIIVDASSRAKESPAKKTLLRNAEKVNDLTTELSRGTRKLLQIQRIYWKQTKFQWNLVQILQSQLD